LSDLNAVLSRQGYKLVGRHSAVKTCHWLKLSLTKGQVCYKEKFYGIKSHRCLQMTPAVAYCSNSCLYCWRVLPGEGGLAWDGQSMPGEDKPTDIVEGALKAHRRGVCGFKGNAHVQLDKWQEAMEPKHVAISLSGEPTNYSPLDELLEEFQSRGMTTFLVTNGTNPDALRKIRQPTQLYVSLSAPSEEKYREVCRPAKGGSWQRLLESLSLLSGFSCPTVVRITAVHDLNMVDPAGYAGIISKCNPTYVEIKAYMHVGSSTGRLAFEAMPSHREILAFAGEIAEAAGYKPVNDVPISRVALLSRKNR
jgi:tRNA wybutosine-synthesizing protein 1